MNQEMKIFLNAHPIIRMRSGKYICLNSVKRLIKTKITGFYSRRINIQHRLVYEVYIDEIIENGIAYEGVVKVARMWTHYDGIK